MISSTNLWKAKTLAIATVHVIENGLGYPSQTTGFKLLVEKICDRQRFSNLILQEINHIYR